VPDVKEWSDRVALNVARIPPGHPGSAALDRAVGDLQRYAGPGVQRLEELARDAG
jgi:hypothetical protein